MLLTKLRLNHSSCLVSSSDDSSVCCRLSSFWVIFGDSCPSSCSEDGSTGIIDHSTKVTGAMFCLSWIDVVSSNVTLGAECQRSLCVLILLALHSRSCRISSSRFSRNLLLSSAICSCHLLSYSI